MTTRERLLLEMSTLTGVITTDYEYLLSLVLRDNSGVKKQEVQEYERTKWPVRIDSCKDLDSWFSKMEEVKNV